MSKKEGLKEDFGSGEEGRLLDKAGEDWEVVCEGKVLSGIEGATILSVEKCAEYVNRTRM